MLAAIALSQCAIARAQGAHFAGVETTIAQGGVNTPGQIAIDTAGDLFVADTGNNRILKENLVNGGYQQSIVDANGFSSPLGIAVDSKGNLYAADSGNDRIVKETLSGSSYSASVIPISGLNDPVSIAVDSSGNLYVSDAGNARVLKETLVGSNYTQSTIFADAQVGQVAVDAGGDALYLAIPASGEVVAVSTDGGGMETQIAGGLSNSVGVAVNLGGVVYISDVGNGRILRVYLTGNYNVKSNVLETALLSPGYLAIDGNDTLYFGDGGGAALDALALGGYNFGSVPVGTTSAPVSLLFSFDGGGSIGAPSVVLQGISGMDFSDAGTGSCSTNGDAYVYADGESCTVDVLFKPQRAGLRNGAALLFNAGGAAIATGYVSGWGDGPQLNYRPGTVRSYTLPGETSANIIVADATGNLYINHPVAAFDPGNAVYKETWTGSGYVQSLVATNLAYPLNIALDGAGNVYVLDEGVYDIFKFSPNADGSYTKSVFDNEDGNADVLAVDRAGNVYFADSGNIYMGNIQIDTPQGGYFGNRQISVAARASAIVVDGNLNIYFDPYAQSTEMGELQRTEGIYSSPIGLQGTDTGPLAMDGMGNIYTLLESTQLDKLTRSGGSFEQSALNSVSAGFDSVTVDGSGNIYWLESTPGTVGELDFTVPPALHFAATQPGKTSTDSPEILTIANAGTEPLEFPVPSSGENPTLPEGFVVSGSSSAACPNLGASSPAAGALAAGAICQYAVSYSPLNSSDMSGWMTLSDDNLNQTSPYATQSIALAVAGDPLTPTVNWGSPSNIVYGTALSATQLNAAASVPGSFAYAPAAGSVLMAGTHTLSTTFTPQDTFAFSSVDASVQITVTRATPTISWSQPAAIPYGTALSSTQLTASTPVAGTFTYAPAAGTVLAPGSYTLTVTFAPADATDYTSATASVTLTVSQATPAITWATPTPVAYGTALGSAQLDATASVPGTFNYSPAAGAVLSAGAQVLTVTFTPNDLVDFTEAFASVTLTVRQLTPAIGWAAPAAITYGTALSSIQLNASATMAGTFSYSPPVGTVLSAGLQTLRVTFTPMDTVDYTTATASVSLAVTKGVPTIRWVAPAPVTYGTALNSAPLNATASVPGTFTYAPGLGTILKAGEHTLTVSFAPRDTTDYTAATAQVTLAVNRATPLIKWPPPAPITYGTKLSGVELNALAMSPISGATVAGMFDYRPASGTLLGAGTHTLSAFFNAKDTSDFTSSATRTVLLTVRKARQAIDFTAPKTPIAYSAQTIALSAKASSGLKVSFTVISGPAKVKGDLLIVTGIGTIKIAAHQAGNEDYDAAPELTHTIVVTR